MKKNEFKIRAKIQFEGYFLVQAKDRKEAEEAIAPNCGAMLGSIQTLDDEHIDWEFNTHGEIIINRRWQKEIESIAEKLGWSFSIIDNCVCLQIFSPAGQDCNLEIEATDFDDFKDKVREYYEG